MDKPQSQQGAGNILIGCGSVLLIPILGFASARLLARLRIVDDIWAAVVFWGSVVVAVMVLPTYFCVRLRSKSVIVQVLAWLAWVGFLMGVTALAYLRVVAYALATW